MSETRDGGPAFGGIEEVVYVNTADPNAPPMKIERKVVGNLSVRDWFAGQAPEADEAWLKAQEDLDRLKNPHNEPYKPVRRSRLALRAEWRYKFADAMLAARVPSAGATAQEEQP